MCSSCERECNFSMRTFTADEESSDEDEQPVTKVANMQNGSIARDQRSRRKAVFPLTNAAVAVEPPEAESNDELEDVDFGIRDSRSEPMEDSDQDSEGDILWTNQYATIASNKVRQALLHASQSKFTSFATNVSSSTAFQKYPPIVLALYRRMSCRIFTGGCGSESESLEKRRRWCTSWNMYLLLSTAHMKLMHVRNLPLRWCIIQVNVCWYRWCLQALDMQSGGNNSCRETSNQFLVRSERT